jgi:hypothetical protein
VLWHADQRQPSRMPSISSTRLDFLFRKPTEEPQTGWNSTVLLVRRECQETLANIRRTTEEESFPGKRPLHRLFASSIVICAAFDLLGKLRYGDEQGVAKPFQKVLTRYGGLSALEARRIYDARNALVHSFGVRRVLPAGGRGHRRRARTVSSVRISLTDAVQTRTVVRLGPRTWQVGVRGMYRLLNKVVVNMEDDLRRLRSTRFVELFNRMFVRHGRIRIR